MRARGFLEGVRRSSRWIGRLGMSMVVLLMFLTAGDSLSRNLLNRSLVGTHELVEFTMAIMVFFSLALSELEKRHVAVDLVYDRLSRRKQRFLDRLVSLLSLTIFALITWQAFLYGIEMWQSRTMSPTLNIPVFPFVLVTAFGTGLLWVVLLVNFISSLAEGRKP